MPPDNGSEFKNSCRFRGVANLQAKGVHPDLMYAGGREGGREIERTRGREGRAERECVVFQPRPPYHEDTRENLRFRGQDYWNIQ